MSDRQVEVTFTHEFISTDCEEAETEIKSLREQLKQAEQQAAALRALIVESADACTCRGCEHCKWLGFNLGRYESRASLAASGGAAPAVQACPCGAARIGDEQGHANGCSFRPITDHEGEYLGRLTCVHCGELRERHHQPPATGQEVRA